MAQLFLFPLFGCVVCLLNVFSFSPGTDKENRNRETPHNIPVGSVKSWKFLLVFLTRMNGMEGCRDGEPKGQGYLDEVVLCQTTSVTDSIVFLVDDQAIRVVAARKMSQLSGECGLLVDDGDEKRPQLLEVVL